MSAAPFGSRSRIGEQNHSSIRPYSPYLQRLQFSYGRNYNRSFMRQLLLVKNIVIKMKEGEHATLLLKARGNKTLWINIAIGQDTNGAHSRDVHCEVLSSGGLDCCKCGCGVFGEESRAVPDLKIML
jgi:hypothetical protein